MSAAAWLYVALVPLCGLVGLATLLQRDPARVARWGNRAGAACLLLCAGTWAARWAEAGHLPLFGTYESALSLALFVLATAALLRRAGPLLPGACLLSAAILGHGLAYDPTPYALTISERSLVVDVHAVLAWAAFGLLAANVLLALLELLGRRRGLPGAGRWLALSLHWGFVLHSAMIASGSLYKFMLFGRAWSFDPIETLALVTWVSYGTLLHLHLFAGWEGRRLAAWCLALFVVLVVSYRGIVYFPAVATYHIFDMDLRMHVR